VNVRIELTPLDRPPTNIGIGRCVEAAVARHVIRTLLSHGFAVDHVVFQAILPHRWILVGTTQVAELSWTPVTAGDIDGLLDPSLSTAEFQNTYRRLATPTERKQPFGLDAIPFGSAPAVPPP
jgi:hypothetical protein